GIANSAAVSEEVFMNPKKRSKIRVTRLALGAAIILCSSGGLNASRPVLPQQKSALHRVFNNSANDIQDSSIRPSTLSARQIKRIEDLALTNRENARTPQAACGFINPPKDPSPMDCDPSWVEVDPTVW